jgi:hypothetical protein
MASVTDLVNAGLFELCRIGGTVRVVAIGTGNLPFPQRHVGRAHKLGLSLQMALGTDLYLRPPVEESSFIPDLRELEAVRGLFHDGMAIDAGKTAAGMGACFPVGLDALLMALEATFVLDTGGLSGILAERNLYADALTAPFRHVFASRTMASFTALLLKLIAGIEQ